MRRSWLIAAAAAAILTAPAARAATPVSVHVSPGAGGPRTTFTVSLRNPFTIGPAPGLQRSETIDVHGPHRSRCVWSGAIAVPAAPAQHLIRVDLKPSRLAGAGGATAWCAGTFEGSVVLIQRFHCAPPLLCPMLAIRPQTIGRFSFRVTRRA